MTVSRATNDCRRRPAVSLSADGVGCDATFQARLRQASRTGLQRPRRTPGGPSVLTRGCPATARPWNTSHIGCRLRGKAETLDSRSDRAAGAMEDGPVAHLVIHVLVGAVCAGVFGDHVQDRLDDNGEDLAVAICDAILLRHASEYPGLLEQFGRTDPPPSGATWRSHPAVSTDPWPSCAAWGPAPCDTRPFRLSDA